MTKANMSLLISTTYEETAIKKMKEPARTIVLGPYCWSTKCPASNNIVAITRMGKAARSLLFWIIALLNCCLSLLISIHLIRPNN